MKEKQEELTYEQAKNVVCENCGHYMSMHIFKETEMSSVILDENGELQFLKDDQVEEIFHVKPGDKVVVMDHCKGRKGKQEVWKLNKERSNVGDSCECDDFVPSLR